MTIRVICQQTEHKVSSAEGEGDKGDERRKKSTLSSFLEASRSRMWGMRGKRERIRGKREWRLRESRMRKWGKRE
jgi:hypothetical protein